MSDELTIQPQIQQPKSSNTPLYTGVGAVAGGLAGYGINRAMKKPMSHDDIIAEVNSKDKFEARTKEGAPEASTWKEVQAQANEVAELKKQAAEAGKPILDENNPAKKAYDKAVSDKQSAYDKLFNEEKARLEGTDGKELKSSKMKQFAHVEHEDWTALIGTKPKGAKKELKTQADVEAFYNQLKSKLDTQEKAVETKLKGTDGLITKRDSHIAAIERYMDGEATKYARQTDEQIDQIFSAKEKEKSYFGIKKTEYTPQYKEALKEASREYPQFTESSLKGEHYLQFGEEIERGATVGKDDIVKLVDVKDEKTGRKRQVRVKYTKQQLEDFVKAEEEKMAEKRLAAADRLFEGAHERIILKRKQASFAADFEKTIDKGLATKTGLYDATNDKLNISQINSENAGGKKYTTPKGKVYTGLEADVRNLKKALKDAKAANPSATSFTIDAATRGNLNGFYDGSVTDLEKILEMAEGRNSVATRFDKESKELTKQIKKCAEETPIVEELKEKIETVKSEHKGLQDARAAIRENFPKTYPNAGNGAAYSADEIQSKATKFAEEHLDSKYQKEIDRLKPDYDKALGESGKVDESAKKAAEEKLATAEKALKEKAEALGKKFKTGGTKGWIAATIGAAALAAAGWGLSSSSKEEV